MGHSARKEPAAKVALLEIAGAQHGIFTMQQAVSVGLTARQVYRLATVGEWSSPLPRVFSTSPAPDWIGQVMAACIWAGEQAAASHSTAAAIWELDGVMPSGVNITKIGTKRSPRDWLTVHRTTRAFAVQRRRGIPVTNIPRTLMDLAAIVTTNVIERALQDALRRRLTTLDRLHAALRQEGGRGKGGAGVLGRILKAPANATESELERRVLRVLLDAGLPAPVCQHTVETPSGFTARVDFAYPAAKLAIEADGYRWHSAREDWSRDRTRLNELVAAGWRVLHVTWADLEDGATELVRSIRSILGQQSLL